MTAEHELSAEWKRRLALDGDPGPASRLTAAQNEAMVESVLAALDRAPADVERGKRPPFMAIAAGIALALVASAATAAFMIAHSREEPEPPKEAVVAPIRQEQAEPLEQAEPDPEAADAYEDDESSDPGPEITTPKAARPPRKARAKLAPADLLQRANELRGRGRWSEAERKYRKVIRRFPGTPSAYVALVAAASLRLEHLGDPGGARRYYARAVEEMPNGALDEEARLGLADAAHALGDRKAEATALEGLIRAHPKSALLERARQRLTRLQTEP